MYIYKHLYEGKELTFDLTNGLTKFVCTNDKTIQFQTLQKLFGKLNLLEMKAIKHLVTNPSLFFAYI